MVDIQGEKRDQLQTFEHHHFSIAKTQKYVQLFVFAFLDRKSKENRIQHL